MHQGGNIARRSRIFCQIADVLPQMPIPTPSPTENHQSARLPSGFIKNMYFKMCYPMFAFWFRIYRPKVGISSEYADSEKNLDCSFKVDDLFVREALYCFLVHVRTPVHFEILRESKITTFFLLGDEFWTALFVMSCFRCGSSPRVPELVVETKCVCCAPALGRNSRLPLARDFILNFGLGASHMS